VSNSTGNDARIPADDLQKSSTEVWRDKHLLFSFGISTNKAHILVFPCPVDAAVCSFQSLFSLSFTAGFSQSTPLIQPQNRHGPLFRLRLRLFGFFEGALLPNFNIIVERELPTMGVRQLEDIHSVVKYEFGGLA
jgi:hypothetical protein